VHAGSDISTCQSLGGHFKVKQNEMSGYHFNSPPERNVGDLGNILVKQARNVFGSFPYTSTIKMWDQIISLDPSNQNYVGGRGLVIHLLGDRGNTQHDPTSSGGAGPRLACCKITESQLIGDEN